jgi:hypothetical protein
LVQPLHIEYKISKQDFLEAQRIRAGRSFYFLAAIGALLVILGIAGLVESSRPVGQSIAATVVGLWLALFSPLSIYYSYRKNKGLQGQLSATISDEGIQVSAQNVSSMFSWNAFTHHSETRNLFLLYQGSSCFNILPKNCFRSGDDEAFRDLVAQKVVGRGAVKRKKLSLKVWLFLVLLAISFLLLLMVVRNTLRHGAPGSPPSQEQSSSPQTSGS